MRMSVERALEVQAGHLPQDTILRKCVTGLLTVHGLVTAVSVDSMGRPKNLHKKQENIQAIVKQTLINVNQEEQVDLIL